MDLSVHTLYSSMEWRASQQLRPCQRLEARGRFGGKRVIPFLLGVSTHSQQRKHPYWINSGGPLSPTTTTFWWMVDCVLKESQTLPLRRFGKNTHATGSSGIRIMKRAGEGRRVIRRLRWYGGAWDVDSVWRGKWRWSSRISTSEMLLVEILPNGLSTIMTTKLRDLL